MSASFDLDRPLAGAGRDAQPAHSRACVRAPHAVRSISQPASCRWDARIAGASISLRARSALLERPRCSWAFHARQSRCSSRLDRSRGPSSIRSGSTGWRSALIAGVGRPDLVIQLGRRKPRGEHLDRHSSARQAPRAVLDGHPAGLRSDAQPAARAVQEWRAEPARSRIVSAHRQCHPLDCPRKANASSMPNPLRGQHRSIDAA